MNIVYSATRIDKQSDELLNHEQGHFNLTEINRRLTMDSIKKNWLNKTVLNDSIVEYSTRINIPIRVNLQILYTLVPGITSESLNPIEFLGRSNLKK